MKPFLFLLFLMLAISSGYSQSYSAEGIINNWHKLEQRLPDSLLLDFKPNMIQYKKLRVSPLSYKLDSSYQTTCTGEFSNKTTYKYDYHSRLIEKVYSLYESNSTSWIPRRKDQWIYTSNGNLLKYEYCFFNTNNHQWTDYMIHEYDYDSQNRMTMDLQKQSGSGSSVIYNWHKEIYTYFSDSIYTDKYYFEIQNSSWIYDMRLISHYNTNSQLILSFSFNFDTISSILEKSSKGVITYNNDGTILITEVYNWDAIHNSWAGIYKWIFHRNSNGLDSCNNCYFMHYYNSPWIDYSKTTYNYDNQGNSTLQIDYTYNESTSNWEYNYKNEYSYDILGRLVHSKESLFNLYWELYSEENISYQNDSNHFWTFSHYYHVFYGLMEGAIENVVDTLVNAADIILPENFPSNSFMILQDKLYEIDNQNNIISCTNKHSYYYSSTATSIDNEIKDNSIRLFPNPSDDYVIINLPQMSNNALFRLYNVVGELVIKRRIINGEKVSVRELKSGMYFYNIDQEDQIFSGKLIVQ